MAHPVIWSPKMHFYAIGNTPAISLTEYIPPDEDASILVLGCGDPRSTLYTVANDSNFVFNRSLDFTFCDSEPAVLARNVIIYTLLYDRCDEETIQSAWKIYFDIFLDKQSFDRVVSHCQKLLDLSSSLETWNSHPYGNLIKFCALDTMYTMRRYWERYVFKNRDAIAMKPAILQEMQEISKRIGDGLVTTSMRSAGIMSMRMHTLGPAHHKHYWKNGVTNDNPSEISRANYVNPTLLGYSSGGANLNLHYGTDPILCFHLAPALAPMQDNSRSPATDMADLIATIQSQFKRWCTSFHKRVNSDFLKGTVVLRFFSGNALSFCKAIRCVSQTGSLDTAEYTNSWGGSTISFVEDYRAKSTSRATVAFNVIETSNIADHLGLLNVLLISAPLLKRDACSILFTHSLVTSKDSDGRHVSSLEKTGVDLPMLALILGLVPGRASSEVTSQCIAQELMANTISERTVNGQVQLFEFNGWRVPAPEVPGMAYTFSCDPLELADALFAAYLEIFADEGINTIEVMSRLKHYTRDTFTYLLSFVKDSYLGDWDVVINKIINSVENNRSLIVGLNYYQELCRSLHLAGICDIVPSPKIFQPSSRDFCFQGWEDIPRTVCIVMVVPRARIDNLLDDSKELKTPCLQCEVELPGGNNAFTSFQPTFGTVEECGPLSDKCAVIHEDPAGWAGKSDLVVHFVAPAWIFVQRPRREYQIGINMFGMNAILSFKSKLGLKLSIYSTTLANPKRAFILRDRPRIASKPVSRNVKPLSTSPASSMLPGVTSRQPISLKFRGPTLSSFTIRCPIIDDPDKLTLADKSTHVETNAVSISSVRISFNGFSSIVHFPYPADTSSLITRIARKSSYVEVEGRVIQSAKVPPELNPFPIIRTPHGPHALSMHYVALDDLPAFRSPMPKEDDVSSWLSHHFMFTIGEEKRQAKALNQKPSGLVELKESVMTMFHQFFQDFNGEPCIIQLSDPEDGCYTMIFVSNVRIDLTAHTLVADACVLPITMSLMMQHSFQGALSAVIGKFPIAQTNTVSEELQWWKAFLPTAVERCRTWKHGKNCEYEAEGIPRSFEVARDPLCSCGRGKNLGRFMEVKEWRPFQPHVTRAVIGIPFSTSLLGGLASQLQGLMKEKRTGGGCDKCGKQGKPKLMACSRCKKVQYCSADCQRADWKKHKSECGK